MRRPGKKIFGIFVVSSLTLITTIFLVSLVPAAHAAFPQIVGSQLSSRASTSNPDTVDLPASIASGDLIIVFHFSDGALTRTFPSPWVEIKDTVVSGSSANIGIAYLIASGGETSVTVTKSADERFSAIAIRISAASWHGTTAPEVSTGTTGSSQFPNPDSVTASWGAEDNLFIAAYAVDGADVPLPTTAWPTNYDSNHIDSPEVASAGGGGIASRELAASSDDPGTFTMTATEQWWAGTVVIRPASADSALSPLIAYSEESATYNQIIRYINYASDDWQPESDIVDTGESGQMQWHVAKTSPDGSEQAVVAVMDSPKYLYVSIFDGTNWDDGSGSPYNDAKNLGYVYNSTYRSFAAAYEQSSGQLLVVNSTTTNRQITYWVWDGTSWIVDGSTFDLTTITDTDIVWIEMASQPGTNQIALIAQDYNQDVVGLIWDGDTNSWGNEKKLNSLATNSRYEEQIAVAYMQSGANEGQAVFVHANSDDIYSWTWTGSAWEGSGKSWTDGAPYSIYWILLAADPNSDDLLLALMDTSKDIYVLPWDGSNWGTHTLVETDAYGAYGNNRPFSVIFEKHPDHNGHALIVYADTTGLRYQHSSDGGTTWDGESTVNDDDEGYWLQIVHQSDDLLHMAIHDLNDDLETFTWDNTSWTKKTTRETGLVVYLSHQTESFALTAPGPLPADITLGEHSSTQQYGDQFDGSSSHTDLNIFRFSLTNDSGSLQTVDEIIFQLSAVSGITDATNDLTNVELFIDGNGTPEAGATEVDIDGSAIIRFTNASGLFDIADGQSVDYVLQGDFANLIKDDALTISLASSDITLDSAGVVDGIAPTPATHTVDDVALLDNHSSGQASNQFVACTAKDDANLFKFQITNNSSTDVTIDEVIFQLSSINGIVNGDLSDLRIYDDTNSQDAATGGTPTIGGASDTIFFSDATNGLFVVPAGETIDYILKGDVINLDKGDSVTISLAPADITLDSGMVDGNSPTDATHTAEAAKIATVNHTNGNYAISFPHQRRVVRDASGYWYAVWVDKNLSTGFYEIKVAKSTNTIGTEWATPVTLFGQGGHRLGQRRHQRMVSYHGHRPDPGYSSCRLGAKVYRKCWYQLAHLFQV